jgi:hypothetical protein
MILKQALFLLFVGLCIYHLANIFVTKGFYDFLVNLSILCASYALGYFI